MSLGKAGLAKSAMTADSGRSMELCRAVQQLVSRVASSLSQSRVASVEDVLGHLETTDENFHNYELVQFIKRKIDGAIGPLVDRRMESGMHEEGDGHTLVAQITEEIFSSPEYNVLCQSLVSDIKWSVEELLEDEALSEALMAELSLSSGRTSPSTQYASFMDSLNSDLSGGYHPREMFIPQHQLLSLTDKLHPSQPTDVREHAVHHLLHYPAGDLPHCEHWAELRNALRMCLCDDISPLVDLTLKLLALMFHSSYSAIASREAHSIIADTLIAHFKSSPPSILLLETGINSQNLHHRNMLLKFRFLNHIHNEVPSYWIRYNERIVEDIVEGSFSLLELTFSGYSRTPHYVGPLNFISLLDPLASWFKKWMHGRFSRMKVLQELARRQGLMEGMLNFLIFYKITPTKHHHSTASHTGHTHSQYGHCELNYLHFVQLVTMLERILLYERGRKIITSAISGFQTISTIPSLLVHLLSQLYSLPYKPHPQATLTESRDCHAFTSIVLKLFKELAYGNNSSAELLLCDVFVDAAIQPLQEALDSRKAQLPCNQDALISMADVMAILASSTDGRGCLLYSRTHNSLAAIHTIAQFVMHHLKLDSAPSQVVCSWLFVCRQCYNTADGLLMMARYCLHRHIASALTRSRGKSRGHKEADVGGVRDEGAWSIDDWEDKMIDNLLNFAGTPKGVLLLYQSGLMERCIQSMHYRYKMKLQVSHCERFGYGYMVSQVSSTAVGTSHLIASGYVTILINDIWTLLDGGEDDLRLTTPRPHPFDPADRTMHKAVINLMNMINSFPSLYEVLQQSSSSSSALATSSMPPTTLLELLKRTVLFDADDKPAHLINFDVAHHCGLCVLRLIVTCLDSLLFLEAQYRLCDSLLALQEEIHLENGDYMIDEGSVARNSLLVAIYFMGGAEECARPPYYIHEAQEDYSWPLFSALPPPRVYFISSPSSSTGSLSASLNMILSSLPTNKETSIQWLVRLRKSYLHEVTSRGTLSDSETAMLLRSCVSALLLIPDEAVFSTPSATDDASGTIPPLLSQMDELGILLVSRYSSTLCIKGSEGMAQLRPLLLKTRHLCSAQQHKDTHHHGNQSSYNAEKDYIGFDWLTAIVYQIMCQSHGTQSHDITWQFMKDFSQLLVSGYLWMPRLHLSSHIHKELVYSGIHPIISVTSHYVELILHEEVPLVYSSFRLSGYAPAQVCQQWLRQCFLNYLDWPEIKLYLTTCVVMGTDYQVYICVAVLKHLEEEIIKMAQSQQLLVFLKEKQLSKFHVAEWLGFMQRLQDKYQELVLPDMQELGRV